MAKVHIDLIQNIRNLLFNGKETDPLLIVKELLQNADDATNALKDQFATFFHLGFSPGIPDAEQVLLRGPGLFAVNDGPFLPEHARAILRISDSSKKEDTHTVGKFGLGLKTVLHLSDVFLFMCAQHQDDGLEDSKVSAIFNPYNGGDDNSRPEWDQFGVRDREKVRTHLSSLGVEDGFTIWVPLRSHKLLAGREGIGAWVYEDNHQAIAALFEERFVNELEFITPLLRHLNTLKLTNTEGQTQEIAVHAQARTQFPHLKNRHAYPGQVRRTGREHNSHFFVHERMVPIEHTSREVPHTAAVLTCYPKASQGKAKLTIDWSVFLPVEADVPVALDYSATSFHLTLHGMFFLSADRRHLLSWDRVDDFASSDPQIARQKRWNRDLVEKGTLPSILNVLYQVRSAVKEPDFRALMNGILQHDRLSTLKRFIVQEGSILPLITEGGTEWKMYPADQRYWVLPRTPHLFEMLPGLKDILQDRVIVDDHRPRLSSQMPQKWQTEVATLLEGVKVQQVVENRWGQEYARLIGHLFTSIQDKTHLKALLKSIIPWTTFQPKDADEKAEVLCVLQAVPREQLVVLSTNFNQADRKKLAALDLNCLIAFKDLGLPPEGKISAEVAATLVVTLEGTGIVPELIRELVDRVDQVDQFIPMLEDVKIFPVTDTAGDTQYLTPHHARLRIQAGEVFNHNTFRIWRTALRQAFPGLNLISTAVTLPDAFRLPVPSLKIQSIIDLLSKRASLGEAEHRLPLLERMLKDPDANLSVPEIRQAVRYVLHARPEQYHTEVNLYSGESLTEVCRRVARQVNQKIHNSWRFLDGQLSRIISPGQASELNVVQYLEEDLSKEVVQLYDTGGEITLEDFTPAERQELCIRLTHSAARLLPLVHTGNHTFVVAASRNDLYFQGRLELPRGLQKPPVLVEAVDDATAEGYRRQLRLMGVRRLDETATIQVLLQQPDRDRHRMHILELLEDHHKLLDDSETYGLIKVNAWLRDHKGKAVAPGNVLCLDGNEDHLKLLLSQVVSDCITPGQLEQAVQRHGGFHALKRKLRQEAGDAIDRVTRLMVGHPQGLFNLGNTELELAPWLTAVAPLAGFFPAHAFLSDIRYRPEALQVYQSLRRVMPQERLTALLTRIENETALQPKRQEELHNLHLLYTEQLMQGNWQGALKTLKFPNRKNQWVEASQLILDASGVQEESVIHRDYLPLLQPHLDRAYQERAEGGISTKIPLGQQIQQSTRYLKTYFQHWMGHSVNTEIGQVLSLLGSGAEHQKLAEEYLPRNYGVTHEILKPHYVPPPTAYSREQLKYARNFSILTPDHAKYKSFDALMEVHIPVSIEGTLKKISITNLLGQPIDVPIKALGDLKSLVDVDSPIAWGDHTCRRVYFYPLPPERLSGSTRTELSVILKNTFRTLLERVFDQKDTSWVEGYWDALESNEQADLKRAQTLIVDSAAFYMSTQLKLSQRDGELKTLIGEIRQMRREVMDEQEGSERRARADRKYHDLLNRFKKEIEAGKADILKSMLDAVQQRMKEAQYRPSSVLFELFQNADDALHNLEFVGLQQPELKARGKFVVEWDTREMRVMHWGRRINEHRFDGKTHTQLGWSNDLENMLTLQASDKIGAGFANHPTTTGKFGMGFKSIFLVTRTPSVISGDLQFKILGGLYPVLLEQQESARLRKHLEQHHKERKNQGTLICLPLEHQETRQQMVESLQKNLPYLTVFSRNVHTVVLDGEVVSCEKHALLPGVFQVKWPHLPADSALLFETPSLKLLIPLVSTGFTALPEDVPSYWTVTPLSGEKSSTVALHAEFGVDIGRSRIAMDAEETQKVILKGKTELGPLMLHFFKHVRAHFDDLKATLGLSAKLSLEDFWGSFFAVVGHELQARQSAQSIALLEALLWGKDGALTQAYLQEKVLPTPQGLASLKDLQASLETRWFDLKVSGEIQALAGIKGHLVDTRTAQVLLQLGVPQSTPEISIPELVEQATGKQKLFHPEQWEWLKQVYPHLTVEEQQRCQKALGKLQVKNKKGTYQTIEQTVLPDHSPEEKAVSGFCPPEQVLDDSYSPEQAQLIGLVRPEGNHKELARISLEKVQTPQQEEAALDYLLTSNDSLGLADHLSEHTRSKLLGSSSMQRKTSRQQVLLSGILMPVEEEQVEQIEAEDAPFVPALNPTSLLRELAERWKEQQEHLTRRYEEQTYPTFFRQMKQRDDTYWMTLLLLGNYQSMGRSKPEQHRSFLEKAHHEGWLQNMLKNKSKTEAWFNMVEAFFETVDDQKHYRWVNNFLPMYQVTRWLKEYQGVIQWLDDAPGLRLDQELKIRSNPNYSGTGIAAPNLDRVLKIGRHFVVREAHRNGLLKSKHVIPECYVPTFSTRKRLNKLGCQVNTGTDFSDTDSRTMHQFLVDHLGEEEATFGGSFDLPFLYWKELMGDTHAQG